MESDTSNFPSKISQESEGDESEVENEEANIFLTDEFVPDEKDNDELSDEVAAWQEHSTVMRNIYKEDLDGVSY